MRLSASLSWAASLSALQAAASPAYVYVTGSTDKATPQTLSPVNARLLLARRLGLSRYHSLGDADETTLKILNDYGGEQRTFFSEDHQGSGHKKSLVIVDDVDDLDTLVASIQSKPVFTMPQSPQASDNQQFIKDLDKQAESLEPPGQDICRETLSAKGLKSGAMISDTRVSGRCPSENYGMAGFDTLTYWTNVLTALSTDNPGRTALIYISRSELIGPDTGKNLFADALSYLLNPMSGHQSTIILMPRSNSKAKRTSTLPYGKYAMPRRETQSEAPLNAPSSPETATPKSTALASSKPKRLGILPVCQLSVDALVHATNNCSGHGTPYLKRNGTLDQDDPDEPPRHCYACKCGKTVLERGNG
ncbi:MAG: hypothetical protein Q9174_005769, partial [Haloplaca sp. 1 TL-2023]